MIKKKAKKKAAKSTGSKRGSSGKQKDPAQVREGIAGMVKAGARKITKAVINKAMQGEVAPTKFLFEMAGVYPASTDGSIATKEEESLAETLLRRLDIPTTPIMQDDDEDVVIRPLPKAEVDDEDEPAPVKSEAAEEENEPVLG